jgi:pSer/pThr/pTyr-binding forkhead associated (FHA) protein
VDQTIEKVRRSRTAIRRQLPGQPTFAMSHEPAMELFRRACGLGDRLALVCQKGNASTGCYTPLEYPRPFMLIGRDPEADLSLNDAQVSRRHAFLQAVAGRVCWIDLESRTKVFEDGQEVPRSQGYLDPGRSIQIGPYRLHRTDRQADDDEPAGMTHADPFMALVGAGSDATPLPLPRLILPFRLGGQSPTWEIDSLQALVGRSDQCQLVLNDSSISRVHASFVRTPVGLWVVDLAAREGVHVNGTRVRWAWLAEGDLLRFGRFTLIVRYENPPEGIVRDDVPLEAGASPPTPSGSRPEVPAVPLNRESRTLAIRPRFLPTELRKASGSGAAFPLAAPVASGGEEWEPVLPTNMNLFSLWQQQMQFMEAFHSDMMTMVQMFVAMHSEHQATLRDELRQVQQLTQELTRLNARLGQLPAPGTARPSPENRRTDRKDAPARMAGSVTPESNPGARSAQRASEKTTSHPPDSTESPRKKRPAAAPELSEQRSTVAMPATGSPDLYIHLTRRITELQRERQGYWQRILKAING